jgi:anti-sigma regulatory factor (Ser/Thr protein kinase)
VLSAAGPVPNAAYRPPEEAVLDHPQPPPPDLGRPVSELHFRAADLGGLRHLVAGTAAAGGLGPDRVADVVLAVNEIASNSVEHGPGSGRLRLWTGDGLVAEVADAGRMRQPFPGMVLPPPAGARGRGLWLASELSDVLQVWTDDGTVVRMSWRA